MRAVRHRLAALILLCASATAFTAAFAAPDDVVVRSKMGGFILGYDIDQAGSTGLLAEAVTLPDGTHDVAVETFDQATGTILKTVRRQRASKNDYVALGIFGNHVGLVEFEHVSDFFVDKRRYDRMDPVDGNDFTGRWTPPFKQASDIIIGMAPGLGRTQTAILGFKNTGGDDSTYVFSSNVGANTFGPVIKVTDTAFNWPHSPVIAMDHKKHRAVLGSSNGCFGCLSFIRSIDLTTGEQHSQAGPGIGFINGIAVDSNTRIACTTTEGDFSVQFWNLAEGTVKKVILPGATSQAHSGRAVAVDEAHKLFLVGQPISSTAASGSSIHVYDEDGNLVESLDGFALPASPAYMALKPSERRGFVIVTPDLTTLQAFTY